MANAVIFSYTQIPEYILHIWYDYMKPNLTSRQNWKSKMTASDRFIGSMVNLNASRLRVRIVFQSLTKCISFIIY